MKRMRGTSGRFIGSFMVCGKKKNNYREFRKDAVFWLEIQRCWCKIWGCSGIKGLKLKFKRFDASELSRSITDAFKCYFNSPWRNYSMVDAAARSQWFNLFKRKYTWRPEIDSDVQRAYHHKAAIRLKDLHNNITKKKKGVRLMWLSEAVHEQMMRNVADTEFKKKSDLAKKNRRGGAVDGGVDASHCQGSISSAQHAKSMAVERGGLLPTAGELYLRTHMRNIPGQGVVPVSGKSKQIKDAYERSLAESQESGSDKDPNQIYYEVVGGRKKGTVPGLGSSSDLYYKRASRGSSSSTYSPSIYSQLSTRLEHEFTQCSKDFENRRLELEAQKLEIERERLQLERDRLNYMTRKDDDTLSSRLNEWQRQNQEQIAELRQTIEGYAQLWSQQCSQQFPFRRDQDPRDPSSGGAPVC